VTGPDCDILVIGAGAAGLFAATWAGRTAAAAGRPLRLVVVDGARKLGAKILVAGGGRCNVTHERVSEADFAGSSPAAIRKVLRRFGVADTIRFFAAAGVELKREETGKLFPVTDSARTVLEALLREARAAGARIVHPARITRLERTSDGFRAFADPLDHRPTGQACAGPTGQACTGQTGQAFGGPAGQASPTGQACAGAAGLRTDPFSPSAVEFHARKVILCTGGRSLPKSGSDGGGYALAQGLGHSLTAPIVPALVPLVLPADHWIRELAGLTLPTRLTLRAGGRRLRVVAGSTLCTHLGLSGPAVLDVSRHWLVARHGDPTAALEIGWLPDHSPEAVEQILLAGRSRGAAAVLRELVPERLARAMCHAAAAPPSGDLPRDARRRLAAVATATPLPITGDRGFAAAEATAGGVPLAEMRLDTLESRACPGLHLAGEILDVDGRIGGFNFQWAWASGFVAGGAAAGAGETGAAGGRPDHDRAGE